MRDGTQATEDNAKCAELWTHCCIAGQFNVLVHFSNSAGISSFE